VILQRALEESGIPTAIVASLPSVAAQAGAPRILAVDTPMGAALGEPDNPEMQRAILSAALNLLATAEVPGVTVVCDARYRTERWVVRADAAVR
jgi:hypothetical protein